MKKHRLTAVRLITIGLLALTIGIISYIVDAPYRNSEKLIAEIETDDISEVQRILESGVDPNCLTTPRSKLWALVEFSPRRPLSVACGEGNYEMVKLLIDYGATAEYDELTGWSPLREVLFRFHPDDVEIVKLLLANGADPGVIESGVLPVFAAADMYPMPHGSENFTTGYNDAAAKGITEIVQLLLDGGSVNMQSDYGETLLMYAAKRGNLCLAEYLISMGCDIGLTDMNGKTAYDYAEENEKRPVAELLIRS